MFVEVIRAALFQRGKQTENTMGKTKIAAAFQGGGAKGIAYVGALRALESQKYEFEAVAGTSAGSIVAALVAAGATASEVEQLMPKLLSRVTTIRPPVFFKPTDFRLLGKFSLEGVREVLESELRTRIRTEPADGDVTFRELYEATKIELDVLVTVEPGVPVLLSTWTSPSCQVSYAVAASCAIPFVMNPQILLSQPVGDVSDKSRNSGRPSSRYDAARMKVVVDGGLWANFPIQCFVDESLRHYYGAPRLNQVPVVGFILDSPNEETVKRSVWTRLGESLRRGVVSMAVDTPGLLTLAGIALIGGAVYSEFLLLRWLLNGVSFDPLGILACLFCSFVLLILGTAGLALCKMAHHAPAAGVALKTTIQGLTSVTVSVPPWLGAHPDSRIVRVPASAALITTTHFTPSPEAIKQLIETAEADVNKELLQTPLGTRHAGRTTITQEDVRFADLSLLSTPRDTGFSEALDRLGMK
jgi:predicted acylesterase/phospholipase RssA/histone H3/H4